MKSKLNDFFISNFKCMKCGECCRAGYDVYINKEDIEKWKILDKNELLDHIIINPQCISINNETELNSEDGNTIKRIRRNFKNFDRRIKELVEFIQENHLYYGKTGLCLYIKTILLDLDYDPVLVPKSFNSILKGLDFGLEYIIKTDVSGKCPFLNLNLCSIHDIKPIGCKKFPYTNDKCLRKDELFLSVCSGLKNVIGYE